MSVKDCAGDDMPAFIICSYCKVTAGQPSKSCDCLCHHRRTTGAQTMDSRSEEWEDPTPAGCIYCGVHDLLYKWENDGPMCMDCIDGAKEDLDDDTAGSLRGN